MAITTAIANSYKQEILEGVHDSTDTYKIALFNSNSNLSAATTTYSTHGEVSGTGYTAGGKTLTDFTTGLSGSTAFLTFTDPVWENATITARGCLIYNSSKSNKAVAVFEFAQNVSSVNGTFTVDFPGVGASSLIRVG